MQGKVVKTTGKEYLVRTPSGEVFACQIKGNFRIKGIKSTNPVAVGDEVEFDAGGFIFAISERKNFIVRRPTNLSKQLHIIAANVDVALLVASVKQPETSTVFIDRFLACCQAYNVPAVIVFNKIDLLNDDEKKYLNALENLYSSLNYKIFKISALENVSPILEFLNGKTALLSGNSGVGKSTLINSLCAKNVAKTAEISAVHLQGMHTTTFSEMYDIDEKTFLIDTPGIKGFGTVDFKKEETGHFFREIFHFSKNCRFSNCTHTHEPGCAVLQAVENQQIASSRYQSYLSVLGDEEEKKYR